VPGTILGIGFVLAFSTPPMTIVAILYALLALFFVRSLFADRREQFAVLALGTAIGVGLSLLDEVLGQAGLYYLLGGIYLALGILELFVRHHKRIGGLLIGAAVYLFAYDLIEYVASPIAAFSRSLPRGFWSNATFQFADYLKVPFQAPPALLAIVLIFSSALLSVAEKGRWRLLLTTLSLAIPCALSLMGMPLALVGTAYIIVAAYAVRSLPASVRSGIAALQQIDPSIEEASNILGGDAQYTFRKVTLPLILPALLAGLIFSFTRHMTSLSAIIFLVSARWRIVTASILSEWEQGGISIAAAYSTVIILFVLIAIGVLYFVTNKLLRGRGDVDLTWGA